MFIAIFELSWVDPGVLENYFAGGTMAHITEKYTLIKYADLYDLSLTAQNNMIVDLSDGIGRKE